jgi:hypothetical protein
MILHDSRLIFVHLRRTAGNSVEIALGGIELFDAAGRPTTCWQDELHRGQTAFKRDHRGHALHATAAEIRRQHPREFETFFKFSIVRNPWAQMASLYGRLYPTDASACGFRRWLHRFRRPAGTVPEASLFEPRGGACLVDFIGRYETLQADFDTACDRAGIPRRTLPRTNAAGGRDPFTIYDDASAELVGRLFAADVERFGYAFPAAPPAPHPRVNGFTAAA